jgi:hypothetical protein
MPPFARNTWREYDSVMAFLIPIFIIAVVLLAAPQIAIGAVILSAAVGASVAITKVVFGITGNPAAR